VTDDFNKASNADPMNESPDMDEQIANGNVGGSDNDFRDEYSQRLERLGGEPAPVITPEEFARLQKAGQVHIDARGRVRTTRRSDAEAGVSLRKRRAWYAGRI
jgi:hypothetical protein